MRFKEKDIRLDLAMNGTGDSFAFALSSFLSHKLYLKELATLCIVYPLYCVPEF